MKHLISAFQFLTILPLGKPRELDASKVTPCFPVVGLGIGLILLLADRLFSMLWPVSVASILDIMLLAILSGGLHLDGLGDTGSMQITEEVEAEPLDLEDSVDEDEEDGDVGDEAEEDSEEIPDIDEPDVEDEDREAL